MQATDLKRKPGESGLESPGAQAADDGFTKVQKRKQRKVENRRPQFQYNTGYLNHGKKIGIAHIRDLSLFLAADGQKPQWIVVENPSSVSHTVVLLVTGLLPSHLGIRTLPPNANQPFPTSPAGYFHTPDEEELPLARVPTIPKLFAYGCPTRAPGDARRLHSVMSTLLQSPLPEAMKKKREADQKRMMTRHKENDGEMASPLLYLCTPKQMLENGYRLPSYVEYSNTITVPGGMPADVQEILDSRESGAQEAIATTGVTITTTQPRPVVVDEAGVRRRGNVRGEEGWVETPEATGPPPNGVYPVLGIDCEMCLSADGQELGRVSIVDLASNKAVFEEFVKPPRPVTDYLSQWSGLSEEKLSSATHTLETIQEALVTGPSPLITPHTILLGHSLDCDLAILKITHPLVIDTTVIYRHPRGPPFKPSLKWLVNKWLYRSIQGSADGHDSEEDARACVELLKMKLIHGPEFGDPIVDTESIFERLARFKGNAGKIRTSCVVDYGNPKGWFGAKATTALACTSDDEIVDAVVNNIDSHDFVFARMTELGNLQHWNSGANDLDLSNPSEEEMGAALQTFSDRLARLHAALPSNTALIMLTGHADPRPMLALTHRRTKWEAAFRASDGQAENIDPGLRWLSEDDRALETAVAEAREGMSFFCVK